MGRLTAFSTRVSILSSEIHIGDDTPKDKTRGFNLLKPNDIYICRTAALTSRRYILNIYSTNIHTEYLKQVA